MSARRAARSGLVIVALGSAVVSGCGGSKGTSGTTSGRAVPVPPSEANAQAADRASLALRTEARQRNGMIAPRYTCNGANESIPLLWAGVGPNAKEIVVLVKSFGETLNSAKINWAVGGIAPTVQQIAAGKVPAGAVVGRNGDGQVGYSLCPVKGAERTIVTIQVLAYPKKLGLQTGFNANEIGKKIKGGGVEWGSVLSYIT